MSLTAPLNLFCDFQKHWINDSASLSAGEKSRRIGWTWSHAYKVVQDRIDGRFGDYFHSTADKSATIEFMEYVKDWNQLFQAVAKYEEKDEVVDDRNVTTMQCRYESGRRIVAGTSNPTFFRSKGGHVGLDEFAFHRAPRELYKAAHATAFFWGYSLKLWSTHNGDGSYFNGIVKDIRDKKLKGTTHRVTVLDAVDQGIVERIIMRKKKLSAPPEPDARARQEWLDELRSTCADQAMWDEEFMCQPQSEANSLLSYELIRGCEDETLKPVEDPGDLRLVGPGFVGVDVGREKDLTVFWVLEKVGDVYVTRLVKRFKATPYAVQLAYFKLLMSQPKISRACGDATGIGDMLIEEAQRTIGKHRVEKVKFTSDVKADLAMPLVALFEDRRLRIPAEAATRESLHKVRKIVTSAGNVRFDAAADEGGHADEFWSLGLAYHAVPKQASRMFSRELKPVGF